MRSWLALSAGVIALDQLTKYAVSNAMAYGTSIAVAPFFNLVHVHNRGAAFSFLGDASGWQRYFFTGIALLASVWIVWLLRRHPAQKLFCLALSLILGGALGNVIDRVLVGAVVDFLDFHAAGWHWPAFNVADSGISVGVVMLVWVMLRESGTPSNHEA